MAVGEAAVRAALGGQAAGCRRLGSPFVALLAEQTGLRMDRTTTTGRRILDWPGVPDANHDALPLRLAGGLHALARSGMHPALAACWPPHSLPPANTLWAAVAEALRGNALGPWLDSPPQTNETGRAAVLMAGLLVVAAETGLPLALFELGASAGLNLMLDRFHHQLGGRAVRPDTSPVRLQPGWTGMPRRRRRLWLCGVAASTFARATSVSRPAASG